MEAHLSEWLSLTVRWIHFIVGVAWIGASFYFNWLENHLERQQRATGDGVAGNLWAVHGGGFYYLQKYEVAPPRLPETLHWFKWEAYTTWISGFALLCVVYYANAQFYMLDGSVAELTPAMAVGIGIAALLLSWFFYDLLCRSALSRHGLWLALIIFAYFGVLAWGLNVWLSGRAAYIHVGAAIGTVMVANVFRVIIPAQKELVAAMQQGRKPDGRKGKNALLRSRHNNYLTLPVLLIMISSHYPGTYGHEWNWLLLIALGVIGVAVRHYFNIRHLRPEMGWILVVAVMSLAGLAWLTKPQPVVPVVPPLASGGTVNQLVDMPALDLFAVVQEKCAVCHSQSPSFPGFAAPPAGLALDNKAQLAAAADKVYQSVVVAKTMPLGNITKISAAERQAFVSWYQGLQGEAK